MPVIKMFMPRLMLRIFNGQHDRKLSERAVLRLLEALIDINCDYLQAYPRTPLLYKSGVRYVRQQDQQEDWHDIPAAIEVGGTDCKVLTAWRCSELRMRGIHAIPALIPIGKEGGALLYHVVVKLPNGKIEDPSAKLGMTQF